MAHRSSRARWWIPVLLLLAAGYVTWNLVRAKAPTVAYRTDLVRRGDLVSSIGATGSLEPEEAVDVGAQVAGQISRFGMQNGKPIDRRSSVKAGDLLAEIDPSLYRLDLEAAQAQLAQSNGQLVQSRAQLAQSDAALAQSEATILKAQADVEQMESKRVQAQEDWDRAQQLRKERPGAEAETIYSGYKAAYGVAIANVSAAKAAKTQTEAARVQARAAREHALAAIEVAQAGVKGTQAAVDRAQRNLNYCTITSPVDGVVIDRRVNIGQTVVSSLNAPSLFLIATDLRRMQIWVSVNEADIGSIHEDQPVTFTVDARPGRTFHGTVTKVRFDATMTQNVVTYPVEVFASNPDGLLYPYMTANVQFELGRRTGVLRVPNAALRYAPTSMDQVAPESRAAPADPKQPSSGAAGAAGPADKGTKSDQSVLWLPKGRFVEPLQVRVGMSDGRMSEVEGPGLKDGLAVVVSEDWQAASPQAGGPSPFVPQTRR